jgi:periplasmic divalent cation tolerance protein
MIFLKTTANRVDELMERLRAEHSYDTPAVVAVPIVSGNASYLSSSLV